MALFSATVQADETVNITVSGTLTRPPCILSTGTKLTAAFGDVQTDKVATTGTVNVPVRLKCSPGSSLSVKFSANNGTQTPTVAKTTAANLGVSLLWADGSEANLEGKGKPYMNLGADVDLSLKAKLVPFGTLTPGAFTSSMVMTISYL
ncbi:MULTISPECIES: fimbrial protein [Pseudomonas]|uniref:Type 1 fimbrial protein n=1 Tax=Pseudomonas juntendi TaxID=2666183 RepID=A0A7W2KF52_9PSED|nr:MULTISPECIES: spore coat protein U domain-containing protein [Pseudomonas]MBA6097339.1 type 1 fimbrial protein [Pseudomonas juntendi]